jgi:hypothetical protein
MKPKNFSTPMLLLAVCTLLVASCANPNVNNANASLATSAADGGRLFIKPSPVLGDNVFITVSIDGQIAGTLMPTGTFDRYIKPGRHVVKASPNKIGDAWQATLDVHAGQTYSYVADYNINRLVLTRMKGTH